MVMNHQHQIFILLVSLNILIDPTLNPDGRDRHTHWVNTYKGSP